MQQILPNALIQSRYLVVQPIGKDGKSEVYLAVDQRLGSAVALKRTNFDSESALENALEREALTFTRLRHPVLPKVIDHFTDGEARFLVMEHISGDDLDKRLKSARKPLPLSWVMFWADQLLDALSYLHKHEPPIIHRDIKPQNLKLTDENHIILLDLGLSKDLAIQPKEAITAGSVVADPSHFAPLEQVRGTGTDARSDLYSLSATLYQLLSDTVPPDAVTRAEAILGGEDDPLRPLDELNTGIAKPISDVILQGMSVRQEQRWPTAAEMQKALRRAFNAPTPEVSQAATMIMEAPANTDLGGEITSIMSSDVSMPTIDRVQIPRGTADTTIRMDTQGHATQPLGDKTAVMAVPTPSSGRAAASAASQTAPIIPPGPTSQGADISPARKAPGGSPTSPFLAGALVGILILIGAGGGGSFYYYKNYRAAAPTPTPSAEPTPIPAINVLDGGRQPSNSVVAAATPGTSPSQGKATLAGRPRSGPSGTKPPVAKATPKPKPGDDRTVIMQ